MKLNVHIRQRPGTVQAFCPDLPGCSAAAATEEEALKLLRVRIAECFTPRSQVAAPGTRVIQVEV